MMVKLRNVCLLIHSTMFFITYNLFRGPALGGVGPIGNNFSWPWFPVNLHQGLYLYVLDKPRVDYTLVWGPLGVGPNWEQLVQLA